MIPMRWLHPWRGRARWLALASALLAFASIANLANARELPSTRKLERHRTGRIASTFIAGADSLSDLPRLLDQLFSLRADSASVATVASVELERDAGVFVLESGTLALCQPIAGRVAAAVFTGHGTFAYAPADPLERDQLERFYGTRTVRRQFESLVLLFADSTLDELRSLARFAPGPLPAAAPAALREALSFLGDRDRDPTQPDLARALFEPVPDGSFYAHVQAASGPLFFRVAPGEVERVQLMRRPDDDRVGLRTLHSQERVSEVRAAGDTDSVTSDLRPAVAVVNARIETTVAPNLDTDLIATLDLEARTPTRWLSFHLFVAGLGVDSVGWEDGRSAPAWMHSDSPLLWVRCEPPLAPGATRRLRVRYHGRLLERDGDLFFNQAYSTWYPRLDFETPARFELEFHVPAQYQVVAAGRELDSRTRDGVTHSRWRVDPPAANVSFDFGLFHTFELQPDSLPLLRVLLADTRHPGRTERATLETLALSRSSDARVAAEIAAEVRFYSRAFGPLPDAPIYAVETSDATLVAYPQLVHIPMTFRRHIDADLTPYFYRAHEVAHQWWGLSVDPRTYHDAWLSEGFADFSAAWYLQTAPGGVAQYLDILRAWRTRILENRRFRFGHTTPAGPIALGDRTNSSRTEDDYDVIIYNKGAWVLHMLRNLMLDADDPGETKFRSLMREFYRDHAGGQASTADFRRAVEHATGTDMGWFFSQWIDHAWIPTYEFSYRVSQAENGFRVHGRVVQSHVPSEFRMDVPVRLDLADGSVQRLRVRIQGGATEFDLPAVASPPLRVTFNDLESVLCEVVTAPRK